MDISERTDGKTMILSIKGRLDATSSAPFSERLFALMETGHRDFVVDFAQLDYISSSGLRVFLMALKRLTPLNGRLVFSSLKDAVREVFDVAGFAPHFPMYPSTDEALRALSGKGRE